MFWNCKEIPSISASIESVDTQGNTPFDYARQKGLNYCLLVILSHLKYRNKNQNNKVPSKQKPLVTPQRHNVNNKNPVAMTTTAKATGKSGEKQLNENDKARDTLPLTREKPINVGDRRSSIKAPDTPHNIVVADEKRKPLKRQEDVKTNQRLVTFFFSIKLQNIKLL